MNDIILNTTVTPRSVYDNFLHGRAAGTVEAYAGDLENFAKAMGAVDGYDAFYRLVSMDAGQANATASEYRNRMVDAKSSPATVNRRLSSLRSIVEEANRFGLIPWTLNVRNARAKQYRDTAGPGHDAFKAMLAKVAEKADAGDAKSQRDCAILRLLYDTALRRKEVAGLDLCDVDLDGGVARIVGKGHTEQTKVSLPPATLKAMSAWVSSRGSEPGPLFLPVLPKGGMGKSRLCINSIYMMVLGYGVKAAVKSRVSPHRLRHSAITTAVRLTNGNLVAVAAFARHANMNTTKTYIDNFRNAAGAVANLVSEG